MSTITSGCFSITCISSFSLKMNVAPFFPLVIINKSKLKSLKKSISFLQLNLSNSKSVTLPFI